MTASVEWDNEEQTVLHITYQDPIKIEDVFGMLEQQAAMLDTVDHVVTLLIDMSGMKRLPANALSNYPQFAKHRGIVHPNIGVSYVVMNNIPMEYIVNIFSRLYIKFQTATSVEEARMKIAEEVSG